MIPNSLTAWPRPSAPSIRVSMAVIICTKVTSPLTISEAPYLQKEGREKEENENELREGIGGISEGK